MLYWPGPRGWPGSVGGGRFCAVGGVMIWTGFCAEGVVDVGSALFQTYESVKTPASFCEAKNSAFFLLKKVTAFTDDDDVYGTPGFATPAATSASSAADISLN